MNRRDNRKTISRPALVFGVILGLILAVTACADDDGESSLSQLQLVGVDFELNSILISNNSSRDVLTDGLWAYRDGESFEFNIFPIEPRATILFSMRDLGEIDVGGGEIALAGEGGFTEADSLLQYVAWGDSDRSLGSLATDAGLWPEDDTVETHDDTVLLFRTDPAGSGPNSWEASDEVP